MGFELAFFQAIDESSLMSASFTCVMMELLGATFVSVCLGVLLRFIFPWWEAQGRLPIRKWPLHDGVSQVNGASKKKLHTAVVNDVSSPCPMPSPHQTVLNATEIVAPWKEFTCPEKRGVKAKAASNHGVSLDDCIEKFFSEAELLDDALLSAALSDAKTTTGGKRGRR
ncbi:hypothetical protein MOQ_008217 [Trypanosoma cruzi marinkellei]|uniref:Uncharacterized protein n=1 Tax=Trypanosoma cruzi marinkellei TaxID=85056 RepID=K2NGH0_TRYCR|nr:hypothetical protein MOQ_008217 [Trypanosoma cruzi marinkellei]